MVLTILKKSLSWIMDGKNRWILFIVAGFMAGFWTAWKIKKCPSIELVSSVTNTTIDTIKPKDTIKSDFNVDNVNVSTRPIPIFKKVIANNPKVIRDTLRTIDSIPYAVHDTIIRVYENQNCYGFKVWFNQKTNEAIISNSKPDSLFCAYAEFRTCSIMFSEDPPADLHADIKFLPGAYTKETTTTTNKFVMKLPFYKDKWFYVTVVFAGAAGYLTYDKLKRR